VACACLTAVVLLAYAVVGAIAGDQFGAPGWVAAAVAAGLILSRRVPYLAEAGVFGLMLAFYLITLTAGTLLTVKLLAPATDSSEARNG
jgi:hypothetical protein